MSAVGGHDVFRITKCFHAKPTADIAHLHADVVGWNANVVAHRSAKLGGRLAGGVHLQALTARNSQGIAGLNGDCGQTLVVDLYVGHVRGAIEGGL